MFNKVLPTFILFHVGNFFIFLQERKQEEKKEKKVKKKEERLRRKEQEREEKEVRRISYAFLVHILDESIW